MARVAHKRITVRRKVTRATLIVLALGLITIAALAGVAYHKLNTNITALDTTKALGTDRPAAVPPPPDAPHKPLNILLIGSDSRKGSKIGGETPGLSDTTILLHINADRTTITGVSIPRDSMVQRPDCLAKDGTTKVPGEFAMFNEAFAIGGPGCTQRTVEQLTGVRTDHFAIINLAGFEDMVDALGGVPICVPKEINDDIGKIYLPAGSYNANGKQALGYVRERHVSSPNGDLGRMKRQQVFLAAMAKKALSSGTVTNPKRLYAFLDATTKSLTTDPDLASIPALTSMATELKDINGQNIRFLSIPTQTYPEDPNRLIWAPEAKQVWNAFRNDTPLPRTLSGTTTNANQNNHTGKPDNKTRAADENGLCA